MSLVTIFERYQGRRGLESDLATVNEVLLAGEHCWALNDSTQVPMYFKVGDGVTTWNSLNRWTAVPLPDPGADCLLFWDDSAGTYTLLSLGTNLYITGTTINATSGASGYSEGTSFPGSPATNDKFYRTDLNLLCYYDGTRWLTVSEYSIFSNENINTVTVSATLGRGPVRSDFGIYITRWAAVSFIAGTSSGASYWTVTLERANAANARATVASFSTGATPDTGSTWTNHDQQVNAVLDATARSFAVVTAKTGTPGALLCPCTLYARLIVT